MHGIFDWSGKFLPSFALLLLSGASCADLDRFEFDTVHSRISFKVSHLGFSDSTGWFPLFSGVLLFDQDNFSASSVQVDIDINSLQMGDAGWNRKLLGRSYFNVKKYPSAQFVSRRVEQIDGQHGRVIGELSLLGRSLPVTLEFVFNRRARHKYTLRDTVGFSASGSLLRSAFGMTAMRGDVGDSVRIELEIEARRKRAPRKSASGDGAGKAATEP